MSNSLRPHESQHARPPCPSPTPGVHWDSRPMSQWCHTAISSSVVPFSSCPQSLPASESFPMSQLFLIFYLWFLLVYQTFFLEFYSLRWQTVGFWIWRLVILTFLDTYQPLYFLNIMFPFPSLSPLIIVRIYYTFIFCSPCLLSWSSYLSSIYLLKFHSWSTIWMYFSVH